MNAKICDVFTGNNFLWVRRKVSNFLSLVAHPLKFPFSRPCYSPRYETVFRGFRGRNELSKTNPQHENSRCIIRYIKWTHPAKTQIWHSSLECNVLHSIKCFEECSFLPSKTIPGRIRLVKHTQQSYLKVSRHFIHDNNIRKCLFLWFWTSVPWTVSESRSHDVHVLNLCPEYWGLEHRNRAQEIFSYVMNSLVHLSVFSTIK